MALSLDRKLRSGLYQNLLIRLARPSDLDELLKIAALVGPGFSSLPEDSDFLAQRLAGVGADETGDYLLVLQDIQSDALVGCAGVKARSGLKPGFWNLQIDPVPDTPGLWDMGSYLCPTQRFQGMSEVGSLFLHPDYRKPGVGRFLALSRYLMVAAGPDKFADILWSELRGQVDPDGHAPFYEFFTKQFLDMPFVEADRRFATDMEEGLVELLPDQPVRLADLDARALDVLARTHPHGAGALSLLESVGFRFDGVVDVLEGGPLVSCCRDDITLVTRHQLKNFRAVPDRFSNLPGSARYIIGAGSPDVFRACVAHAVVADDVQLAYATCDLLDLQPDEQVLLFPVKP